MLFWIGVALAAVPEGVDLDEVGVWEDTADQLLDGPAGCWEMVGVATWDWQAGRFGENRGDAAFAGKIEDGIWGDLHIEPLGEWTQRGNKVGSRVYTDEQRFAPLIGQIMSGSFSSEDGVESAKEASDRPDNVLRSAIDEVSGDASTSFASWSDDEAGVILHRDVAIGDKANAPVANVEVLFPGGGTVPSTWDVMFPESFRLKGFPNPQIRGAEVHLRGHVHKGQVFPLMETFSFQARVLGIKVDGAQTIVYKKASPCKVKAVVKPVITRD